MTIGLVGLGNIGSQSVPHLARLPVVSKLLLVDRDRYERHNLENQLVDPDEIGRWKATVQKCRARRLRPDLAVEDLGVDLEDLPLGVMRVDLLLGAVDSRRARQRLNEIAWRLRVLLIDAGVEPSRRLVRVSVFSPGSDSACLECGWSQGDYNAVEARYSCSESNATAATGGSSALGATAAALQALEVQRWIADGCDETGNGQLILDTATWQASRWKLRRNGDCRFDHRALTIEGLDRGPEALTFKTVFEELAPDEDSYLRVPGHTFATKLICPLCRRGAQSLYLASGLRRQERSCGACGRRMKPLVADWSSEIRPVDIPATVFDQPLNTAGLRAQEVIEICGEDDVRCFELGGRYQGTEIT